jgi:hypothetical protein
MTQTMKPTTYPDAADRRVTIQDIDIASMGAAGQLRRISWGAVFAGLALALVTQLTLYLLGLSIGALTVNPMAEQDPLAGLGTAFVIWDAASTLIALFIGGWVAGRLAGIPSQADGAVHGLVVWATTILASIVLLSTTVGSVLNSTANLLGQTASTTGSLIANVAPETADAVQAIADETGIALTPEAVQERAVNFIAEDTDIQVEVTNEAAFRQALIDFGTAATQNGISEADREALQTSLAETTTLSEDQIEEVVASVATNVDQLTAQVQETVDNVQQQATQVAGNAADTISTIAGVLFASLIVGAFAAGLGGYIGAPKVTSEMEMVR